MRNAELEANLLAHSDDRDAYLVYADWLQSRGDPRGELIAVQVKLAQAAGDAALRARETELLAAHRAAWLGDLAALEANDFGATWRNGFLRSIRLGPSNDSYGTSDASFPDAIAALARLEGTQLVDELVIGAMSNDDYPTSWEDCVAAIAEHGVPENLRRLAFDRGGYWDISSTELGDLSPAYPRLARLRELEIELGAMELGAIVLPALRSLRIITGGLRSENLASFRTAVWPELETLALCIGGSNNDYGCTVELDDLAWIFAGENLPRVRHLGLANSSLADQIARLLAGSKILGQLETLDLSRGTLGDEGAVAILGDPGFARLRALDLRHAFVSDQYRERLAKLGPAVDLADPQADDDGYRYTSIGE